MAKRRTTSTGTVNTDLAKTTDGVLVNLAKQADGTYVVVGPTSPSQLLGKTATLDTTCGLWRLS